MDNQQGPTVGILLSVTWQPGWERYLGENGLHVYVWVSPFAFHLKLSRHCWLANLPNPGIEPRSPTLQAGSLPAEPPGKAKVCN